MHRRLGAGQAFEDGDRGPSLLIQPDPNVMCCLAGLNLNCSVNEVVGLSPAEIRQFLHDRWTDALEGFASASVAEVCFDRLEQGLRKPRRLTKGLDATRDFGCQFPGSWLPHGHEQLIRGAEPHFRLLACTSGRLDYIETISQWNRRIGAPSFRKTLFKLQLAARRVEVPERPGAAGLNGLPRTARWWPRR